MSVSSEACRHDDKIESWIESSIYDKIERCKSIMPVARAVEKSISEINHFIIIAAVISRCDFCAAQNSYKICFHKEIQEFKYPPQLRW